MKYQRDIYQITEWKDGCVYKTKFLSCAWIDLNGLELPSDLQVVSLSTKVSQSLKMSEMMRKVDDSTPSMVMVEK